MHRLHPVFFLIPLVFLGACNKNEIGKGRNQDFNLNWSFMIGDTSGVSESTFRDQGWTRVNLPHDWSIMDYDVQDASHKGPFFKDLPGGKDVGYLRDGSAWYRKVFTLAPATRDQKVYIHFDGVQTQSEVWVNSKTAGEHVYGYTPFWLDITDLLNAPGKPNVIAVKTANPGENSRWFAGAGIYRNVALSVVNPVSVLPWGTSISSSETGTGSVKVEITLEIGNASSRPAGLTCSGMIKGPEGQTISLGTVDTVIQSSDSGTVQLSATVPSPQRWSPDHPHLYTAEVTLMDGRSQLDQVVQTFGIRSISCSAERGFLLNGEEILLHGGCMHHDNGLLGSAAFRDAEFRRVRIMKEQGFNAIRTSHNPPSKEFLNACDALGMLVIDEAFDHWVKPKRPNDYSNYFQDWHKKDIQSMVLRDRNHPSIVMWSIGNEVQERADPLGIDIAKKLITAIHEIDTSRPVTQAVCGFWDNPGKEWDYSAGAFAVVDIGGYNYQWEQYESDHQKFPERVMYGSESVPRHAWENWQKVLAHPYVIGDFVWTGMDYIGESGIGHTYFSAEGETKPNFLQPWPWYVSWCGDIDITGNKKSQSYYRDILWGQSNLELAVRRPPPPGTSEQISFWGWPEESKNWTWPGQEGKMFTVVVYSSFPVVRLELNGITIAEQTIDTKDKYTALFNVPYQPGILKAIGLEGGEIKESVVVKTTGEVAHIHLRAERSRIDASAGALVFVNVDARDAQGLPVANATNVLKVKIDGPAQLMAAGNGAPQHSGSFTDDVFSLFQGRGLIILRSTGAPGEIFVQITGSGLQQVSTRIIAE